MLSSFLFFKPSKALNHSKILVIRNFTNLRFRKIMKSHFYNFIRLFF